MFFLPKLYIYIYIYIYIKIVEYHKVNVKLSESQLNKLKSTVKNRQGLTLRMNIVMCDGNNLPHELLLTSRQKTKLRNAFENNMSTITIICLYNTNI